MPTAVLNIKLPFELIWVIKGVPGQGESVSRLSAAIIITLKRFTMKSMAGRLFPNILSCICQAEVFSSYGL